MSSDGSKSLLTTSQAAALLGVSTVTVQSYVKDGALERCEAGPGRGWSFNQDTVVALLDYLLAERSRWTSIAEAVAATDLSKHRIKQGIAAGVIGTRTAARKQPTVDRGAVLRYAQQLAETPRPSPRPSPPEPPDRSGVWVTSDQAGALLGLSRQRVGQLAIAERLPATRRGQFWWCRRDDIERYASARRFVPAPS